MGVSLHHPASLTIPLLIFLQLIKEKLLDLLGKEEDEGSHDENMVRVACRLACTGKPDTRAGQEVHSSLCTFL